MSFWAAATAKTKWTLLAVPLLVILLYLPCTRYDFVAYDDHLYVYQNDNVRGGLTAQNALWAFKSCGYAYNWHPLTWMSLQTDATISKTLHGRLDDDELARVMHVHNILLHAANALLALLLMLTMWRTRLSLVPCLLVLLWALHPLRTEAVCWISERKELLCVFWMLLSMICWVRPRQTPGSKHSALSPLSFICFALSLLAKPLAVTLPATLFAWDWIMRGKPFVRSLLRSLPFFLCSVLTCCLTMAAQGDPINTGRQFSVLRRIALVLSAPVVYIRQTFWPSGLSAFYPSFAPLSYIEIGLGVLLLLAMGFVSVRWLVKRERWAAFATFAVVWAYISLLPMLGIIKVGDQPHSDRYTYWVGCAAVILVLPILRRLPAHCEPALAKTLTVFVAIVSLVTWNRIPVWKNSFVLYVDAVGKSWAVQPVCALSKLYRAMGPEGLAAAERMLREASAHGSFVDIEAELANVIAFRTAASPIKLQDGPDPIFSEVRILAGNALATIPDNGTANEALGIVAMKEGRWQEAMDYLKKAERARKAPDRIKDELAICQRKLDQKAEK